MDGQTDEIAIASTALAMRALQRAVKMMTAMLRKVNKQISSLSLHASTTLSQYNMAHGIHVQQKRSALLTGNTQQHCSIADNTAK